jgi:hypothetical protein
MVSPQPEIALKPPRYGGRGEDVNRYEATRLEILGFGRGELNG